MEDWVAREGLRFVPRDRLRALSRKSDVRGWLQTGSFAVALAFTTAGLLNAAALPAAAVAAIFIAHGVLLNCPTPDSTNSATGRRSAPRR